MEDLEKLNNLIKLKKFWKNKKVFVTGHTGFKGSWLVLILNFLGARIAGYSLKPEFNPNLFTLAKVYKNLDQNTFADIRDYEKLENSINKFKPSIIIHMAAQPLVRDSYKRPKYTFEVNINGTLNLLNISKNTKSIRSGVIITSDKVYKNINHKKKIYNEHDKLGGLDPYSSSKSCAEFITNTYINSYFSYSNKYFATARAGNVIGGGDFSKDRIIPDFIKSLKKNKLSIRNPNAIRPWQHVFDPLVGYLMLAENLYNNDHNYTGAWNFGPSNQSNKKVLELVKSINKNFEQKIIIKIQPIVNFREEKILRLNSIKSKKLLNWKPKYNFNNSVKATCEWYKHFFNKQNMENFSKKQILDFFKI